MAVSDHRQDRLPCGAGLEALVVQVFDGAAPNDPGHQADCPHCRAALARLGSVHHTVGTLAAEPVTAPPGLVRGVMHRLRRDEAGVLVSADGRGTVTITERVVTQVAARSALAVPEVAFASVQLVDGLRVAPLRLSARLVVRFGPSLPVVAEAARRRIRAAVEELAGVPVDAVDVLVDDLA